MINIFLVTKQKSVFGNIPVISSTEAVRKLEGIDVISCDTENSGLDFMTKDVLTLQTGNADFQIVWDVSTIDISVLKDIMKTKVITTTPDEAVDIAIQKLEKNNISALPVIDKASHVVGILTAMNLGKLVGGITAVILASKVTPANAPAPAKKK